MTDEIKQAISQLRLGTAQWMHDLAALIERLAERAEQWERQAKGMAKVADNEKQRAEAAKAGG